MTTHFRVGLSTFLSVHMQTLIALWFRCNCSFVALYKSRQKVWFLRLSRIGKICLKQEGCARVWCYVRMGGTAHIKESCLHVEQAQAPPQAPPSHTSLMSLLLNTSRRVSPTWPFSVCIIIMFAGISTLASKCTWWMCLCCDCMHDACNIQMFPLCTQMRSC